MRVLKRGRGNGGTFAARRGKAFRGAMAACIRENMLRLKQNHHHRLRLNVSSSCANGIVNVKLSRQSGWRVVVKMNENR